MALALGKRKRGPDGRSAKDTSPPPQSPKGDGEDLQDIFRRAFEASFKPLEATRRPVFRTQVQHEHQTSSQDVSDWEGFDSDQEDADSIQVFDHSIAPQLEGLSKADQRAFMQSRPPVSTSKANKAKAGKSSDTVDEDKDEEANLKKDLDLQRLITESQLLGPSKQKQNTHKSKVLDMRLKSLGSKTSFLDQQKMPMAHRQGMTAKAGQREALRRREARENGIVLEKAKKPKKGLADTRRDRGVGGPSVGKYKGGTLSLSKHDVSSIKRG